MCFAHIETEILILKLEISYGGFGTSLDAGSHVLNAKADNTLIGSTRQWAFAAE